MQHMHTIYHTEAVILKSQPQGESNKLYWLFTEELGLVRAVATGVRKGGAKLKGQLRDYGLVAVDLVRGKDVWRLTSARLILDPIERTTDLARPYVRTLASLERFLGDEGSHPELFAHIRECAEYVSTGAASAKVFDTLAICKTLAHLGYIALDESMTQYMTLSLAEALEQIDEATVKRLIALSNEAIKETHL